MQKLKNIEFLRVFLIITIVLYHMRVYLNKLGTEFYTNMFNMLEGGRNGVEAFFIISGFFLVLTFKNLPVWEFIKKKYFRLMPAAMFSIIICGIAAFFHINHFKLVPNIVMGLLFSHFGIYWCKGANIVLWYVSALFFGLIIFYLIIKFAKEKYRIPIFLTLGIGSYVLLSLLDDGTYKAHSTYFLGFIPACTLRAFGGMGLGCAIAKFYQKYKDCIIKYIPSKVEEFSISVLEFIMFGFIIWWSYLKTINPDNFLYVLSFCILFFCFLCKKGYLSKLMDKDIWTKMSLYTYSLFVIHLPVIRIISKTILFPNRTLFVQNPFAVIITVFVVSCIVAIITYYLVEKLSYELLSKKFLKRE